VLKAVDTWQNVSEVLRPRELQSVRRRSGNASPVATSMETKPMEDSDLV